MGSSGSFIPIIVLTLLGVAAGIALMLWSRRARRIDDHRTCRRCRFDLTGLRPDAEACPECGGALAARRAIRIGNRRVHRPMLMGGLALILLSLGVGGLFVAKRAANYDFNRIKPVWLLVREVREGSAGTADAALGELARRLTASELPEARAKEVVVIALARQADQKATWSRAWGDYLEAAWQAQMMTPDERADYLLAGMDLLMTCRNTMRQQHGLSFQMDVVGVRLGSLQTYAADYTLERLTIGPAVMEKPMSGSVSRTPTSRTVSRRTSDAVIEAPLGAHELTAVWTLQPKEDDASLPPRQRTFTITKRVTIIGRDDPPVRLLVDAESRVKMAAGVSISELVAYPPTDTEPATLDIEFTTKTIPCTLIGRTYLREPNPPPGRAPRQWEIGTHYLGTSSRSKMQRTTLTGPDAFDLTMVDVVFIPDPDAAEADPNVDEIWGEEVVIRGVKVEKMGEEP